MIKIHRISITGRDLGLLPYEQKMWLYKGLNTKTQMFCEIITDRPIKKEADKYVKDLIKTKLLKD